jgi:hypothetical protein
MRQPRKARPPRKHAQAAKNLGDDFQPEEDRSGRSPPCSLARYGLYAWNGLA